MLRIGIVAGEASGDKLGADLIKDIQKTHPHIELVGIGGAQLIERGCRSLFSAERLAVTGISEVFGRYFELLRIRRRLIRYFIAHPPDVFIGIDAPDFNLGLEKRLRHHGIKTVHYVGPSVWAWRQGRLKTIAAAVDLVLVLFPFELCEYRRHAIPARYVGHPLITDKLSKRFDKHKMQQELGVPDGRAVVALMPGSRQNELARHADIFLQAVKQLADHDATVYCIANVLDEEAKETLERARNRVCPKLAMTVFMGDSLRTMAASDVVLACSGTVTFEAMLLRKPMVVAYKVSWLSYQILRRLLRISYVALPNLLAKRRLVPECLQHDCTADKLSRELSVWLHDGAKAKAERLAVQFDEIQQTLLASHRCAAADAVLGLLNKGVPCD